MTRKPRSHVRILIYWPWAIFRAFAGLYIYLTVFVFRFLPVTVWFHKISISPPPPPRMVLSIRPPHPRGISVPEGSCITAPLPLGISYFPFHGLKLPYLEIIHRVPFKINCCHLKTQLFVIFYLFIIFYKAICISYAGRACLIDYEQTHEARKQRFISLCHLKKTFST